MEEKDADMTQMQRMRFSLALPAAMFFIFHMSNQNALPRMRIAMIIQHLNRPRKNNLR